MVEIRETRVLAEEPRLNSPTHHKHRRCGSVIGSVACVLSNPATELAESHQKYPVKIALGLQIFAEGSQRIIQFPQQPIMRARLIAMGVKTTLADIIDPGWQAPCNHPGHQTQTVSHLRPGIINALA